MDVTQDACTRSEAKDSINGSRRQGFHLYPREDGFCLRAQAAQLTLALGQNVPGSY